MLGAISNIVRTVGLIIWVELVTVFAPNTLGLVPQFLMPAVLEENSGLVWDHDQMTFWTHNDSGDKARLFEVDTTGKILREVVVEGATNMDWEELAIDRATRTLFIGDFGNNRNKRRDLTIYKVNIPDPGKTSVLSEKITFQYPDQVDYPPVGRKKEFDMEAMIYWNESLFLFSKNRTEPYSGYTKMYRLPAQPGDYVAELVDSFATGGKSFMAQWITAADVSPTADRLVLLSNAHLWVFSDFEAPYFFKGKSEKRPFEHATQKEAVTFRNDTLLYISEEKSSGPGALYQAILKASEH